MLLKLSVVYIGYFEAARGYVIYLTRAQPEGDESHIPGGTQNNLLIFHMNEVDLKNNCKEMLLFRGSFGMRI